MPKEQSDIKSFAQRKKERYVIISDLIAVDGLTPNQIIQSNFIKKAFESQGYECPKSASSVSNIVIDEGTKRSERIKEEIKKDLADNKKYSILLDEWTSIANRRYMCVVLKGEKTHNLGMCIINGSATAENLLEVLESKLDEFGLKLSDCVGVTTDGASVMKKMQSKTGIISQLCYNHAIHLCVRESIATADVPDDFDDELVAADSEIEDVPVREEFKDSLRKMKKVTGLINHSAVQKQRLDELRKIDNKPALSILTIVDVRWNSIYLAVQRFLELLPQIEILIGEINRTKITVILH